MSQRLLVDKILKGQLISLDLEGIEALLSFVNSKGTSEEKEKFASIICERDPVQSQGLGDIDFFKVYLKSTQEETIKHQENITESKLTAIRECNEIMNIIKTEGIDGLITFIRKNGSIKLGSRSDAEIIQGKADEKGYNFKIEKQGWDWLVIDADK